MIVDTDPILESMFDKNKKIMGAVSANNEVFSRCFVNLVISECVLQEMVIIQSSRETATHSQSSENSTSLPTTPRKSFLEYFNETEFKLVSPPVQMALYVDVELKQQVTYKRKTCLLTGIVDYLLGYNADGTMSGNLIVVEAKRKYRLGDAYGQLLSYMGMLCYSSQKILKANSDRHDPSREKKRHKEECNNLWGSD